ncbi:BREX-1 system adenine-specific DNA-methyltransferase PglX [Planctellipticum variicoloris]|uniref:BREX-1 system adenine-specific DNA-methyltransferase PglX n=1 Tax=Planctellipticum variicoloris TaxID=3064265 RepID=UPI0030132DAE|nr:BREX-1 system adenine-specific DNA-methyltransferase PglX [Planctomycetaceae bacterium SH412]
MNRTKLKNYAPQARRDFLQAITDRALFYGIREEERKDADGQQRLVPVFEPIVEQGNVAVIAGRDFPRSVVKKRKALEERITAHGFRPTMEALAYTWFNRLVAIRYMELHGYLEHGYRVLSHPEGKATPEILEHAEHVELPGLPRDAVIDLKLAGNKESELYRRLLVAQCNALHTAMPFLFEKLDDETELLLPDNLLHSDSLIRKLVGDIDEEDWQEVEIIGWLYQFYISEKKDAVIGKVVASEDIPAATQLFTPNWIVKYLVQNTLGRQWLATYPQSALRQQMEYYIDPAEQTPEVQEQLQAITPTSLNPEELTLLDPACGSGHILVEAYDLFKAIYQERGYRARDIPALILRQNLFGLEIDDRAAQLAAFALMMKARADDRRLFDSEAKPNIVALQDSQGLNAADITHALNSPINKEDVPQESLFEEIDEEKRGLFSKKALAEKGHVSQADIASLVELFDNAKTFGSLIQIPPKLAAKLPEIEKRLEDVLKFGDLTHASAHVLKPLLRQARLLGRRYDAVVANPPYMGSKFYTPTLKAFINTEYKEGKADLYACFMERNNRATKPSGFHGMINIPNWMFLSSFEELRKRLFDTQSIDTFIHNGRGVFGSDFGSCAFVIRKAHLPEYRGSYRRLFEKQGSVASNEELESRFHTSTTHTPCNADFATIPGCPVAYWVSEALMDVFAHSEQLGAVAVAKQGLATADNSQFLRRWHEVDSAKIGFGMESRHAASESKLKWFPYNKGGEFRKWYGNNEYLVNWEFDGKAIREFSDDSGYIRSRAQNTDFYFLPSATWSFVSVSFFGVRYSPKGFIFDVGGSSAFPSEADLPVVVGFLCSSMAFECLKVMNPTVNFQVGNIATLPFGRTHLSSRWPLILHVVNEAIAVSKSDWDSFETSWDFATFLLLDHKAATLPLAQEAADAECRTRFAHMKMLEEDNNRHFLEAYGLQDELSPEVPDDQITLYRPDREEDIKRLLSYAIGCIMGRYSLDKPGLIYAHSGNQGFDPSQYKTFRADDDGIIPLLETDWGIRDDATNRIVEFISVAWPKEHLEENLTFVADSLGPNNGEQPRETIRRYVATGFYKHHLSIYRKRPIYWLFSSGKQRAFQCLVYLHRYHEGTLARMRTEYVFKAQGAITARIDQLATEITQATSTSQRKKFEKERDRLRKQQAELLEFDEKLKHAADQRIRLDLDDGVKVNYAKFGDLLAESKAITGGKDEE